MTLEQWAYSAEIVGVVLIVVSLVYVARQLHQNNELRAAQARSESLNLKQADSMLLLENPDLSRAVVKSWSKEPLNDFETLLLTRYSQFVFCNLEAVYAEVRRGLIEVSDLPVEAWAKHFNDAEYNKEIGRPHPTEYWRALRDTLNPDFVQWIEKNIVDA